MKEQYWRLRGEKELVYMSGNAKIFSKSTIEMITIEEPLIKKENILNKNSATKITT